jgi:uncharacterized protein YoxC
LKQRIIQDPRPPPLILVMAAIPALPEQPDFELMAEDFGGMIRNANNVGQQLKRFANVPAVREGQLLQVLVDHTTQILQRMEAQNAALVQSMNQLSGRVDQLSGRVDQLSQKIDSIDKRVAAEYVKAPMLMIMLIVRARHVNSVARLCNNSLVAADRLEVLYNVRTNERILELPDTLQGIQGLSSMNSLSLEKKTKKLTAISCKRKPNPCCTWAGAQGKLV